MEVQSINKNLYIVFEIQPPESFNYASPYIDLKDNNVKEATEKLFDVLRKKQIDFIIKEGTDLTSLTSNVIMHYTDFLEAYFN